MDFSIESITDKFKNPTFLLLAVGVGGVGLYSLLSSGGNTSDGNEEVEKTVVYQNEGGYTAEDIQNYTENVYYALAETFGTGLESLGDSLIESQELGFSNIQQIISNNSNDNAIIDDDTTSAGTSSTTSTSTKKKTSTKKSTTKSTKKYFKVGTWGKDSIYETTLSGIAVKFKTTVSKLMKLNPSIKNPDLIYAGQRLRVA